MSNPEPMVYIVDDDGAMRDAVQVLVRSAGMNAHAYGSADDFLASYTPGQAGCLVLDVRMPGTDGLELQEKLAAKNIDIPIVFLTGHGDVPLAVTALKRGAVDFLAKPFREQKLLDCIKHAIERDGEIRNRKAARSDVDARLATLTSRQREVLDMIVDGKSNKMIAHELSRSHKTIEAHRTAVMAKMEAQNIADLVHMALTATPE